MAHHTIKLRVIYFNQLNILALFHAKINKLISLKSSIYNIIYANNFMSAILDVLKSRHLYNIVKRLKI